MKNKKQMVILIVAVFIAVGLLFSGLHYYNKYIENTLNIFTKKTLYEIAEQQKFNIESELENRAFNIKSIAMTLSNGYIKEGNVYETFNEIIENMRFDFIGFSDCNGNLITSNGEKSSIKDTPYFKKAIENNLSVSEPIYCKTSDEEFVYIVAPVVKNNDKIGFVIGMISLENIKKLIFPCFGGDGYTIIFNELGEVISTDINQEALLSDENIAKHLSTASLLEGGTINEIKSNIMAHKDGMIKYAINNSENYAVYKPFIINGWTIMVVVPQEIITLEVDRVMQNTTGIILIITIILILLTVFVIITLNNNKKNLQRLAFFDEITNAPNLAKFKIDAEKFIEENKNKSLLLIKFDIQKFKLVNQILGEEIGNRVIINIAEALKVNTPGKYLRYARLHGDEFLVLHDYSESEDVKTITQSFKNEFNQRMGQGFEYPIKFIAGYYYMSHDNCFNINQGFERANIAHKEAKKTGNEICVYAKKYAERELIQVEIERKAQNAIDNFEFKVYLHGKYEAKNEIIVGAESLVRWISSDGAIMMPSEFISIFENNGFIVKLDFYMFEETCKIIKSWIDTAITPVPVSVNFSTLHIFNYQLADNLADIADKYHVPHKYLEIEFTETVVASNENRLIKLIEQLHDLGFEVSMDDFGTGYSSLGMLKNMNFDTIKIDRSFFMDANENIKTHSVLSNMINMSIDLGMNTVAEGVEKKEHVELMRKLNCDVIQGYYFSKPIPAHEFTKNITNRAAKNIKEIKTFNRFNLRKNNELLTDVLYTMPLAFTLWDKNANLIQCNKEAAEIVGAENEYDLMERLIQTMPEFQPNGEISVDALTKHITTAYEKGLSKNILFTLLHMDGREVPCEATFVRLINKGEFLVATYIRDMTLQVATQEMLNSEHLKLQTFMDTVPLCFNLWDEQRKNSMCNKAAVDLFELNNQQEYINDFADLSPKYQPDGLLSSDKARRMIDLAFSKGDIRFKWTHKKPKGEEFPTEITLIRTQLNGKNVVVGFTKDLR